MDFTTNPIKRPVKLLVRSYIKLVSKCTNAYIPTIKITHYFTIPICYRKIRNSIQLSLLKITPIFICQNRERKFIGVCYYIDRIVFTNNNRY